MSDEHALSATSEKHYLRNEAGANTVRWRGRCSCGTTSFMHYSTAKAAKAALRRTHLATSSDDSNT